MIKAILFDFDGVISDSKWDHYKSFNSALADTGIKLTKKEFSRLFGIPAHKIFKDLFRKYDISKDFKEYTKKKNDIYYKNIMKVKPNKGAINLVKKLTKNYKLAMASNEVRKDLDALLKKFGIKKYFKVVLGLEDVKKQKPSPEIYLKAAKKLNVKPKECVVVEDSPYGVLAAKKAKMKCIAVLTTHKKPDLRKADFIVRDLESVKSIINSNFL